MSVSLRFSALVLILACWNMGCGQRDRGDAQAERTQRATPHIAVTSQPLLQMTQAVVGDAATVALVVPVNTLSRDWSPTADDARIMQRASLILISGAGYEPWRDRVSLPGSRLHDTAAGYYNRLIRIPDAVTHQHGPDGPHSHPGTVWATWLDPELCAAQLHQVGLHCGRLMPERRQKFEEAKARLSAEINTLNSTINSLKIAIGDESVSVFSDAPHYQYLIERLGWKLHYFHWAGHETLSEAERRELRDTFDAHPDDTRRIFLMDSRRSAETEAFVRESGGVVVKIDLCESAGPESAPFPARLKSNLLRLLEEITKD
jgi:zinc transport system substrate-binding protein